MKGEVCKGTATEQESFLQQSISAKTRLNRGDRDGNEPAAPPLPPERLRPRRVPAPRLRALPPLPRCEAPGGSGCSLLALRSRSSSFFPPAGSRLDIVNTSPVSSRHGRACRSCHGDAMTARGGCPLGEGRQGKSLGDASPGAPLDTCRDRAIPGLAVGRKGCPGGRAGRGEAGGTGRGPLPPQRCRGGHGKRLCSPSARTPFPPCLFASLPPSLLASFPPRGGSAVPWALPRPAAGHRQAGESREQKAGPEPEGSDLARGLLYPPGPPRQAGEAHGVRGGGWGGAGAFPSRPQPRRPPGSERGAERFTLGEGMWFRY